MAPSISFITLLAAVAPVVSAQSCISLAGSTQCPAFNSSSISTNDQLRGLFPFLQYVSSRQDFDTQLSRYINTTYVQTKYQQILGCSNVQLSNTTSYYARYTTSVICNAIVQNSVQPCSLTGQAATPLCADSCATFAINEEEIATDQQLCGRNNPNFLQEIRADFTNCALPANSLTGTCITAERNEPNNCGFSTNLGGLCNYCAASSPNATDSCCSNSDVRSRCQGVSLPSAATSLPPLFSSAAPTAPPAAPAADANGNGLSGGAIAGIVIGSVAGAALLAILAALLFICCRRRHGSQAGSVFNQPSPKRDTLTGAAAATRSIGSRDRMQPTPGGRVTRMTALEDEEDDLYDLGEKAGDPSFDRHRSFDAGEFDAAGVGAAAAAAGVREGKRPAAGRRTASLSSGEMLSGGLIEERDSSSPLPGGLSSPENGNNTSSQSEQLPFFKDYYSSDNIHPGDRVSVLWGYQPRANDEFELERGEMLKVIGIWDDGWATGVQIPDRSEAWVGRPQRDSGVSNGSTERPQSPIPDGEVKAFPLVCVCLPQHWQKTIEGSESASPPMEPPAI